MNLEELIQQRTTNRQFIFWGGGWNAKYYTKPRIMEFDKNDPLYGLSESLYNTFIKDAEMLQKPLHNIYLLTIKHR